MNVLMKSTINRKVGSMFMSRMSIGAVQTMLHDIELIASPQVIQLLHLFGIKVPPATHNSADAARDQ